MNNRKTLIFSLSNIRVHRAPGTWKYMEISWDEKNDDLDHFSTIISFSLIRCIETQEQQSRSILVRLRLYRGIYHCFLQCWSEIIEKTRKTASYLKPQAIENSFKRAYGEVEDNINIYIERLKT